MGQHGGRTAAELLGADPGRLLSSSPWATGFGLLDSHLGGGLQRGELILLGGAPGLGKTTMALQIARSIAQQGGDALYLCYEHSEDDLLTRLLVLESGLAHPDGPALSRHPARASRHNGGDVLLDEAVAQVRTYGSRIRFLRAFDPISGPFDPASPVGSPECVLIVDYLQKVPGRVPDALESERVTGVVERLKDLALRWEMPVLAIVAADRSGIDGSRLQLHDLRGSTALAYEADVALILNDKHRIVARHHLVYGNPDAVRFQDFVVCTVAKNRSGKAPVDLEMRKRFSCGCFDPEVTPVAERLIDDRVYID